LLSSLWLLHPIRRDYGSHDVAMLLQPDHLDDLAYVIMHEMARMIYRVDSDDVGRACNQVQISAGVLSCQSEDL